MNTGRREGAGPRGWLRGALYAALVGGASALPGSPVGAGGDEAPVEVELTAQRGERHKIFRTGRTVDGKPEYRMSVSTARIHYRKRDASGASVGDWLAVDQAKARETLASFVYEDLADGAVVEVEKLALSYTLTKGLYWFRMEGPQAVLTGRDGNTLNYLLPDGTKHRTVIGNTGVQQITRIEGAGNGVPKFRISYSTTLTRRDGPAGDDRAQHEFGTADERVFALGKARAWEAAPGGKQAVADVGVGAEAGELGFNLDTAGLKYPYEVDPTASFVAGNGDGLVFHGGQVGGTWDQTRNAAAGTFVWPRQTWDYTGWSSLTRQWGVSATQQGMGYQLGRNFYPFDTSGLPEGAGITAAGFSLYNIVDPTDPVILSNPRDNVPMNMDGITLHLIRADQASPTALSLADYNRVNFSSLGSKAGKEALDAGQGYFVIPIGPATLSSVIDTTGYTKLAVISSLDLGNTAPKGLNYLCTGMSEGGHPPRLDVTYTDAAGAPVVATITPSSAPNTGPVSVTITGSHFTGATSARLRKAGQSDLVMSGMTVTSDTRITGSFQLAGAATGAWDVQVTNLQGAGTLPAGFTVNGTPPPAPASVTPSSGKNSASVSVSVAGSGFTGTTLVRLIPYTGYSSYSAYITYSDYVAMTGLNVASDGQITGSFPITSKAPGSWDLLVTNPGGTGMLSGAFAIEDGRPSVSSITPSSAPNTGPVSVTVTGSNFTGATSVKLQKSGQSDIAMTGLTVTSDTRITGSFPIAGAATGAWDVVVSNAVGSGTLAGGFTVTGGRPVPTSITPSAGRNNGPVSVAISGSKFTGTTSVMLKRSGQSDIAMTGMNIVSDTEIRGSLPIAGAAVGPWDVEVASPEGNGMVPGGFMVIDCGPPAPLSMSPLSAYNYAVKFVGLTGANFTGATAVVLKMSGQADIAMTDLNVVSDTGITGNFPIAGAALGPWDVVVTNPGGSGTLPAGFLVVDGTPAPKTPSPSSRTNNGPGSIYLSGSNFTGTTSVRLRRSGQSDIVMTSLSVVNDNLLSGSLPITGAEVGAWDIAVTNPSGTGMLPGGFAVTDGRPIPTSLTPSSGWNNGPAAVTLSGSRFTGATSVVLRRSGQPDIAMTGLNVVSDTEIAGSFQLADAALGAWDIVATNAGGSGMLAGGFTVTQAPPTVTAITPDSESSGKKVKIDDLTGTRFMAGATVLLRKAGQANIAATDVVVASATRITCRFDLDRAAPGAWDVVVTNPGGEGILPAGFTVTP